MILGRLSAKNTQVAREATIFHTYDIGSDEFAVDLDSESQTVAEELRSGIHDDANRELLIRFGLDIPLDNALLDCGVTIDMFIKRLFVDTNADFNTWQFVDDCHLS